jgi:hypothetical protein
MEFELCESPDCVVRLDWAAEQSRCTPVYRADEENSSFEIVERSVGESAGVLADTRHGTVWKPHGAINHTFEGYSEPE